MAKQPTPGVMDDADTTGALPSPPVDDATQAQDLNEAAVAQEGFEHAAARVRGKAMRRPQEAEPSAPQLKEPKEGENFFDQFQPAGKIGLSERARLNAVDGFYRGTLMGSTRLSAMATYIRDPDKPDASPEEKKSKQRMRAQFADVIADLARYDNLNPYGTSTEGAVALLGTLGGSMLSPESWAGAAAKGGSLLARTGKAALQQGAITGLTDPVVQGLNMQAGVQANFDYVKPFLAGTMGAIIGGGLHVSGELVGNGVLRLTKRWLGKEDHEFIGAGEHSLQEDASEAASDAIEAPNPAAEAQAIEHPALAEAESAGIKTEPLSPTEGAIHQRMTEGEDFVPPPEPERPPTVQPGKALSPEATQAAMYVRMADKPSVSLIQRKMKLGFEAANKLMDELEEGGIVSPRDEQGLRTILPQTEEQAAARNFGIPTEERKPIPIQTEKTLDDIVSTNKQAPKVLAAELAKEGPVGDVLRDAREAFTAAVKTVNDSGFRVEEINSFNARNHPEVLEAKKKLSQIGGATSRLIEGLRKSKGEITPRVQDDLKRVRELVGEVEKTPEQRAAEVKAAEIPESEITTTEVKPKRVVKRDESKMSVLQFIASRGGLRPTPELAVIFGGKNPFIPGFGRLLRKGGMTMDKAVEAAVEGKFMPPGAHEESGAHNKLHELIDEESRGRKQYAMGKEPAAKPEDVAQRQYEIEQRAKELLDGVEMDEHTRADVERKITEIMDKEGETSAENAAERLILEAADKYDAAERHEFTGDIAGWDVDESGAAFEGGERFAEEKPATGEAGGVPSVEKTAIGDQFVLPGGGHSTRQLAAAREAAGHGRMLPKRTQKEEAGPLFAPGETEEDMLFTRQAGGPTRPSGGRLPPPPREVALRSLQQQSIDLAEALDIPLRTGRVEQGAVGQFSQKFGIARVKDIADFAVVAHELGHGLEAKVGQPLTAITYKHDAELSALVPNPHGMDPGTRIKEGFAEYMQQFMNNPARAASLAPGFTNEFKNLMQSAHPDVWTTLLNAADGFRAWRDAPSGNAIHAVIRSRSDNPEGLRGVIKDIREMGLATTVKNVMMGFYRGALDEFSPMTRTVREMARIYRDQTGKPLDLKAADNPAVLIRFFKRTMQTAVHDAMDGVRPYHGTEAEGPNLPDAMALATGSPTVFGKWQSGPASLFFDYLTARMGKVQWERFHAGELEKEPVPFSHGDAVQFMAEAEKQMPNFRKASDMIHEWALRLLQKQVDAGITKPDILRQARLQEFYVPLIRDMSPKKGAESARLAGGGSEGPGSFDIIKRFRGSHRDIVNPMEALMMKSFLTARTIHHNEIIKSFVDLSKKLGIEGGRFVEEIPGHEARKLTFDIEEAVKRFGKEKNVDPLHLEDLISSMSDLFGEDPLMGSFFKSERTNARGEPIVFYRDGGEVKAARLINDYGHEVYDLLTQMPQQVTDWFSQTIGAAASIKRAGITYNPTFMLSNYVRDQFATAILYRNYFPIISGASGIYQELTQGEHAKLYSYAGGVAGGAYTGAVEQAAKADINVLAKRGYIVQHATSLKGAMEAVSLTEAGTRNSIFGKVYEAKRAQGLSKYEAMWEAAYQAQDILDFGRHGSRTNAITKFIPFLNAHFQGLDKFRRTMVEPITMRLREGGVQALASDKEALNNAYFSWVKMMGVGPVLGAMWAALNWESDAYRNTGPGLKGTHVVVPVGDKIVVVPKPFELATGFTMGEYAYAAWAKDDARAAGHFMNATWQAIAPPNPISDMPVLSTGAQLWLGRSFFTGQDIVPEDVQGRETSQQYNTRTSSMAKHIGNLIGVSPMKVDFAIGDAFGTWGRDAMTLSSAIDESTPAQNWYDRIFARRFIKDPARTSDATTRYWDYMRRSTGKYNQDLATYQWHLDAGRDDQAREFMSKLPVNERSYVIVNKAANEDGKPAFDADEKRVHPLQRSYNAVTVLNGLRKEVADNRLYRTEDGTSVPLTPVQRRDLLDGMRELGQMEMTNGLTILGEPGYKGRPLLDLSLPMERIKRASPVVAEEIANRYATKNVYTTKAVAAAWPKYRDELIKNGSNADIGSLAYDVKGDGYEFGADRLRNPPKRRIVVEPGQLGLGR